MYSKLWQKGHTVQRFWITEESFDMAALVFNKTEAASNLIKLYYFRNFTLISIKFFTNGWNRHLMGF